MINKRGQSLVLFIIVLPVLLILFATIVELAYLGYMKRKVNIITSDALSLCLDSCEKNDIIKLYDRNGLNVENINIKSEDNTYIDVTVKVESYIKKLINKNDYLIKVKMEEKSKKE